MSSNHYERDTLSKLIDGTHVWPNWNWIDGSLTHWQTCASCRDEFPAAYQQLLELRGQLESNVSAVVGELHRAFEVTRTEAKHDDSSAAYRKALSYLAAAGEELATELWSINTA